MHRISPTKPGVSIENGTSPSTSPSAGRRRARGYPTTPVYSFASTATTTDRIQPSLINARGSSHPDSVFQLSPKLVIKAFKPYLAKFKFELSFQQDDYFFVIDQRAEYYEVINPVQKLRGLVPIDYFEEIRSTPQEYDHVPSLNYHPISPAMTPESIEYPNLVPPDFPRHYSPALVKTLKRKTNTIPRLTTTLDQDKALNLINTPTTFFDNICFVDVPDVQVSSSQKKWMYTILLRFLDGTQRILYRSYDEFFNLQLTILLHFPIEAGYDLSPRQIPFLPAPQLLDADQITKRKQYLGYYLDALLFTCPEAVVNSDKMKSFFTVRDEDLQTSVPLAFDSSAALLDLIDNFKVIDKSVTIRLTLGHDIQEFDVSSTISYTVLREIIQDKLAFTIEDLLFKDEADQMIVVFGERDLQMLLKLDLISLWVS